MSRNAVDLRQRMRALIEGRDIACDTSARTWGGRASGEKTCAGCGEPISPGAVEFEVAIASVHRTVFFHAACHAVWLDVCREAGPNP